MVVAKVLGWIAGGLIALLVVLLLGIKLLVNPNSYRDRIEAAVKAATGRELVLNGKLKLSVFPWVALELGPATLSSPLGFGPAPFLSFQHAAVRVKLLPLLGKKLQVAKMQLDGLDLNLRRNAQGQGNWSMGKSAAPAASDKPSGASQSSGGSLQVQSIGGIAVTHGRVSYPPYTIDDLDFETGAFAGVQTVPVTLKLKASRGVPGETFDISGTLDVSRSADGNSFHLAGLALSGGISQPGIAEQLPWALSAPTLDVDLTQQTLALPALDASLADAKLSMAISGTRIVDNMNLAGSLALSRLALRKLAASLGVTLPATQDPHALSSLAASLKFSHDAKGTALEDVLLKLDDTTLRGSMELVSGTPDALKFNLSADRINLDRYTAPDSTSSAPAQKPAASAAKSADAGPAVIVQGTFALAAAHVAGLDFTDFRSTLDYTRGVAHLDPTEASLYGGRLSGDITYDQHAAVPAIALVLRLANIDAAQLVANTSAKGRVSGKANVNLATTARGADAAQITRTLNGKFDMNIDNGALEGIDLGYAVAEGQALLNKQIATSVSDTHRTRFDTFRMSAPITNGVATTSDLSISSAALKVTGQGSVSLPTQDVHMTLLVKLMSSARASAVNISLKVTGKYTDPTIRPDLQAAAEEAVKGAVKQKLQDVLKNGLRGLFGH